MPRKENPLRSQAATSPQATDDPHGPHGLGPGASPIRPEARPQRPLTPNPASTPLHAHDDPPHHAVSPHAAGPHDDPSANEAARIERLLVERAQSGDTTAMRELYERYATSVHRFAIAPLVHDRTLAEDLLADTFVRAMENITRFRWQGKGVLPWLIRIAKNLALDHLRKSGRFTGWPDGFDQFVADEDGPTGESATAEHQVTALLRTRIDACLEEINPRYGKVLRLRLVEAVPRDRAAAEMDVSVGTLDVLLFRACKAFRKLYAERYGENPRLEFGDA